MEYHTILADNIIYRFDLYIASREKGQPVVSPSYMIFEIRYVHSTLETVFVTSRDNRTEKLKMINNLGIIYQIIYTLF